MNARSSTWARAFHDIVLSAHPYGWVEDGVPWVEVTARVIDNRLRQQRLFT